jgi:hypothetical protein
MDAALEKTLGLCHDVIYVLALPQGTAGRKLPRLRQGGESRQSGRLLIDAEDPRSGCLLGPQSLLEETPGGFGRTRLAAQQGDGLAGSLGEPLVFV